MSNERQYDAYQRARYIQPGCPHFQGKCKCDPPYWLREPTAAEEAHERRFMRFQTEEDLK